MNRMHVRDWYLRNLDQVYTPDEPEYLPREHVLNFLKHNTGQDFGYNRKAWDEWLDENPTRGLVISWDYKPSLRKRLVRFIKRRLGLAKRPTAIERRDFENDPILQEARKLNRLAEQMGTLTPDQMRESLYRSMFRKYGEKANIPQAYKNQFRAEAEMSD